MNLSQCRYIQGGGDTNVITNSNNPADYVLVVILRMIGIKFEKDLIKIEWTVGFWYFALKCPESSPGNLPWKKIGQHFNSIGSPSYTGQKSLLFVNISTNCTLICTGIIQSILLLFSKNFKINKVKGHNLKTMIN